VLETEGLVQRAQQIADRLRRQVAARIAHYEMVRDVRGIGMLIGVEFQPPAKLRLRLLFEAFTRIHPAMFGQVLVMRLFRDKNLLTQVCGNNFMVLKVAPALTVNEQQAEEFVDALAEVVELMHSGGSLWSEPLGMVRRIIRTI
jgi:ornithine--oxo-acid transaminase